MHYLSSRICHLLLNTMVTIVTIVFILYQMTRFNSALMLTKFSMCVGGYEGKRKREERLFSFSYSAFVGHLV